MEELPANVQADFDKFGVEEIFGMCLPRDIENEEYANRCEAMEGKCFLFGFFELFEGVKDFLKLDNCTVF